ncbi:uncharacterized protein isoform X2 [Macaca fascicularis]|uniref:uncharacterized protein isoform X2 n=1 Tax=Macaca fascicularis TaxID=9541 RepID=UPI001E254865|nr:uncharacterized protein LOC123569763 isoform X2 [Macaca fascicularis]
MPVTVPRCRDWRSDGLRQPHPTQFPADLGKSPPSLQVRGPPAFPRGAGRRVLISDLRRVGEAARPPVLQPWGPHEMVFCHVAQASLKLADSSDPSALTNQSAGITESCCVTLAGV